MTPAAAGAGRLAAVAAVTVLAVSACGPFVGRAVAVERSGSRVTIAVEGHNDPGTQAWLCPKDPGPGETWGAEGSARLANLGCLDLGVSNPPPGSTPPGWSTVIDVTTLPAERVLGFTSGSGVRWRLLLVAGDAQSAHEFSADVEPFNLRP